MYKHQGLTREIIGSFYAVYGALGYGFLERVYEEALAVELQSRNITFRRQDPIRIYYRRNLIGEYYADLVVANKVIVELKANQRLLREHSAQLLNYLKATRYEVGLLLNFGPEPVIRRHAFDNRRKGTLSWVDHCEDLSLGPR
jgi:GxxExxY protein